MKELLIFLTLLLPPQEEKNLPANSFQQKLQTTPDAVLLDVRTDAEVSQGFIEGAIQIDYSSADFHERIAALDKNKTYFVYCAAGGRSGETVELMKKLDFKDFYNLAGGITAWKKSGLKVVRK